MLPKIYFFIWKHLSFLYLSHVITTTFLCSVRDHNENLLAQESITERIQHITARAQQLDALMFPTAVSTATTDPSPRAETEHEVSSAFWVMVAGEISFARSNETSGGDPAPHSNQSLRASTCFLQFAHPPLAHHTHRACAHKKFFRTLHAQALILELKLAYWL